MSDSIKKQDTEYTNKWDNCIEITKTDAITENHQTSNKQELSEAFLNTNNSVLQGELSQLIQNFNKISVKETDPVILLSKKEYLSNENDFVIIVDKINDFILELSNKGIKRNSVKQQVVEYFNDNDINSKDIYNWLLNNQNNLNSNPIFILGYFNYYGIITKENNEKAFNLFINASEKGHVLAQLFVGDCYKHGYGTPKNENLSFEYYEKVANQNYAIGQLEVGCCYEHGYGIKKDTNISSYWYEKAANNGNTIAMFNLGIYYENNKDDFEKDYNKAFELFKQSAEGGCLDGIMMLGYCYNEGIGTKIDKQKAFELYQNAANLGDITAQYNLALMYEKENDIDKAIYWYEKSAEQGDTDAQDKLKTLQTIDNF
jgi:TPR repeat protein